MMKHAVVVEQAEQQRAHRVARVLVPAKAGDDAVRGSHVLDLQHRALSRQVRRVHRLDDDAVQPRAFELPQPVLAPGRAARVIGVRYSGGFAPASATSSSARRSPCGIAMTLLPSTARRSKATNDAGDSFASLAILDAAGCRRSCSASKSRPRGVTMTISPSTTQSARQHVRAATRAGPENSDRKASSRGFGCRRRRRCERRSRGSHPIWARRDSRLVGGSRSAIWASMGSMGGARGKDMEQAPSVAGIIGHGPRWIRLTGDVAECAGRRTPRSAGRAP